MGTKGLRLQRRGGEGSQTAKEGLGIGGLRLQRRGGGQGGSDYKGVEVDQGAQATEEERGLRLQRRGGIF